ncbi:MAG TPA: AP2/ERF family transcription factor [Blastocatellia bacterium]|nr:AP2/ERF family transcription factor [Blastocatellia bacterium]
MSISRIDQPDKYNHGYYVRVTHNLTTKSKFFADKAHGGKRAALKAAKEFEEELIAANSRKKPVPSKRNKSGIIGVCRGIWIEAGEKVTYWQAAWIDENGNRKNRKFSVKKYGEEKARKMAIKARREGVQAKA